MIHTLTRSPVTALKVAEGFGYAVVLDGNGWRVRVETRWFVGDVRGNRLNSEWFGSFGEALAYTQSVTEPFHNVQGYPYPEPLEWALRAAGYNV